MGSKRTRRFSREDNLTYLPWKQRKTIGVRKDGIMGLLGLASHDLCKAHKAAGELQEWRGVERFVDE